LKADFPHLTTNAADPAAKTQPAGDYGFVDGTHSFTVLHTGAPGDPDDPLPDRNRRIAAIVDQTLVTWDQGNGFAESIAAHGRITQRAECTGSGLHAHVQADHVVAAGITGTVEQAQQTVKVQTPGW